MRVVSREDFNKNSGKWMGFAREETVFITIDGKVAWVLVSAKEYDRLGGLHGT